jgi:hypothetical protein
VRRYAALLLAVLTLGAGLVVLSGLGSAASSSQVADPALSARQCALAGRVYLPGQGCSRNHCVRGAYMSKEGHDAELCEKAGRKGWAYGQPINSQRCRQLGRVWTGPINICASNPDRRRKVIPHAPQCLDPRATYVSQREEEGYYDECLSPRRLRQLSRVAKSDGITLPRAAKDRSAHNCDYRGGWVFVDGVCERRVGPPPASALGGTFMTGDSVSWRAWDDLRRRTDGWTLDLRPGRRLDELAGRLDWYRADHGDPDRVLIELGTNRRAGYTEAQFRATMATIPAGTPVLLFLPFREPNRDNANLVAATKRYGRWYKRLAAERPMTCLADWPAYAAKHLSNLVDGEHPDRQHEDWYARYVVRAWSNCEKQLGL